LIGALSIQKLDRNRKKALVVRDLADIDLPVVAAGSPAREAFDILTDRKLEYLPVVNENGVLLGLVTRTSMVNALASVVWGEEETA